MNTDKVLEAADALAEAVTNHLYFHGYEANHASYQEIKKAYIAYLKLRAPKELESA